VASFRRRTNGLAPLALRRDAKAGKTNAKPQNVITKPAETMNDKIIIFLLLSSLRFLGQTNLVMNPSFESFTLCPTTYSENITCTTNWTSFRESPGYLNSCGGQGSYWGVPKHYFGYQSAASGNSYVGVTAFSFMTDKRDVVGSQLSQTLNIGQQYFVSIKVNLSEINPGGGSQRFPSNKIGIRFSTAPYSSVMPVPIDNFAHFFSNDVIVDTLNWTTVGGSFIADSNYKYIMVGNFFDDANTDTIRYPSSTLSYIYIDDVCVSTSSAVCSVPANIKENALTDNITIYPNPSYSSVFVSGIDNIKTAIKIVDPLGNLFSSHIMTTNSPIDISTYPNGVWFFYLYQSDHVSVKKIIIDH
jgi:hypothetical protein